MVSGSERAGVPEMRGGDHGDCTSLSRRGRGYTGIHVLDLTVLQVTPESDPRPEPRQPGSAAFDGSWGQRHNPVEIDSDPEEADIEEHVTRGPRGSVVFTRTFRSTAPRPVFRTHPRRGRDLDDNSDPIMRDFQAMIGNLVGPEFRPGQAGRSGANTLFDQGSPSGGGLRGGGSGPAVVSGHYTFVNGNLVGGEPLRPRNADGPQQAGAPIDLATYAFPSLSLSNGRHLFIHLRASPDQLARLLGGIFPAPGQQNGAGVVPGVPAGLQGLFAAMLNPANARSGDAVYSQEALDQIISTLMEQHPTSNAPGPASPDAISSLPKKKLDEKELGPEGKGECSVCMDDVAFGTEVVVLPCSHWFHETCASAWLSEHNTCPICRKGIENPGPESSPNHNPHSSRHASQSSPATRNEARAHRLSNHRSQMSGFNSSATREARLDSIRNSGRLSPVESHSPRARGEGESPVWQWMPENSNASPRPSPRRRRSDRSDGSETYRDRPRDRDSRRGESRRSSHSAGSGSTGGGNGGSGLFGMIRDRFLSGGRRSGD